MSSTAVLLLTGSLGAAWPAFRDRGTERLVLAGGVETAEQCALYRAQVPDADWTVLRLRLGDDTQRRRRALEHGLGFGMTDAQIEFWIRAGSEEEHHLDSESFYDGVVDTGDVDREGAVDRIVDATGWSDPAASVR
jgi:hypothetical protein